MQNIKVLKIGRYEVKVGKFPDGFRFNIFNHDKSLFDKGVEETEDAAVEAAKMLISKQHKEKISKRIAGVPTATEFAEALTAVDPSDGQWEMLKAHYNAPERKMTSSELAEAAGYKHMYGANTQYGLLGHELSDYLSYRPEGTYDNGEPLWITELVNHSGQSYEDDTGHFQHELRDEVAKALKILGAI